MLADNLRWVEATSDDGERREEGGGLRCAALGDYWESGSGSQTLEPHRPPAW